jgi:hypothetical protein
MEASYSLTHSFPHLQPASPQSTPRNSPLATTQLLCHPVHKLGLQQYMQHSQHTSLHCNRRPLAPRLPWGRPSNQQQCCSNTSKQQCMLQFNTSKQQCMLQFMHSDWQQRSRDTPCPCNHSLSSPQVSSSKEESLSQLSLLRALGHVSPLTNGFCPCLQASCNNRLSLPWFCTHTLGCHYNFTCPKVRGSDKQVSVGSF